MCVCVEGGGGVGKEQRRENKEQRMARENIERYEEGTRTRGKERREVSREPRK